MLKNKIYTFMGLAKKAGKLVSGEFMVENSIVKNEAVLVIVTEDSSMSTQKKFLDMCNYRGVKYAVFGIKEELGKALGKDIRATVALLDKGFAEKLLIMISQEQEKIGGDLFE